jgi:hypothetical protein
MGPTLAQLIPIAIAVALSTVPILATVLILLSPNRDRSALPFLVGWVVGIAATAAGFALGVQALPSPTVGPRNAIVGVGQIVVGVGLVIVAIVRWRRGVGRPPAGIPNWLRAVGSFGPWSSGGLALGLNLRPKALLLSAAAGLSLRGGALTVEATLVALGLFTIVASSTVVVPIVLALVSPERAEKWLVRLEDWIVTYTRVVTVGFVLLVGVVIVVIGVSSL